MLISNPGFTLLVRPNEERQLASLELVFILFVIFQIKHFVADYPLQREYMLKKTLAGWDFMGPLAMHCAVHAGITLGVVLIVRPHLWWLAVVDFVVHFFMDRIKSGPRYLGRFNDRNKSAYWICFGLDQMVHHLTSCYIIWELAKTF